MAAAGVALAPTAHAQTVTPAIVFQQATVAKADVQTLLQADLLSQQVADRDAVAARPRHVHMFALDLFDRVQTLRRLNGLAVRPTPLVPARDIRPSEVLEIVERVSTSLADLGPGYGVRLGVATPPVETAITPARVLARLRGIRDALDHLSTLPVVPNEVYRKAATLRELAQAIAANDGHAEPPEIERVTSATPADALAMATRVAAALTRFAAARPGLAPPDGVFAPPEPAAGAPVTPADVLAATNFLLADMWAVATRSGATTPLTLAPPQAGRTPVDVRDALAQTEATLLALLTEPAPSRGTRLTADAQE